MKMSKEKQIEEMAKVIKCKATNSLQCPRTTCAMRKATEMYNAGYRKQREGGGLLQRPSELGTMPNTLICTVVHCVAMK